MAGSDKEVKQKEWFSVPVPRSSGTSLQVADLAPATDYQFSVLAHNKVGTGPFSEISAVRTLDPPPRRTKLQPPSWLSANQSSAGVVLRWSPPADQFPPVAAFVLQSRVEQGAWLDLEEDIDANRSEIIIPGLRKDCVYELRLLSRRGGLLSEPSPSVNVSTMGMDMYPASSRLLKFVPEPLLASVMGGVGFLCLAILLVLGTACLISHKRQQRRRMRKEDPPSAVYRSSLSPSPDSVLKKKLLSPHPLYPGSTASSSSSSSSSSASSSSSQSGRSFCGGRRQQLLSSPPPQPSPYVHRGSHRLLQAYASPGSCGLELISRGPDGRFIDQPFDQIWAPTSHSGGRSLESTDLQKSASLRSERGDRKEPAFVLSVDLPPCGPDSARAVAKHLSIPGRFYLDEEQGACKGLPDQSSLYLDSSSNSSSCGISVIYPQGGPHQGAAGPRYPSLKRADQPSSTASTLVLQMEHERETGNLSRCLTLAREREELERELRKYTLERNGGGGGGERRREKPGMEGEERWSERPGREGVERRETVDVEPVWKPNDNTFLCSNPQVQTRSCSMTKRPFSPSYTQWDASPLNTLTRLAPALNLNPSGTPINQPLDLSSVEPHLQSAGREIHPKGRLSHSEAGLELEVCRDSSPLSPDPERDESRSLPRRQKNNSSGFSSFPSPLSFPATRGPLGQSNPSVAKMPGSPGAELSQVSREEEEDKAPGPSVCVEMNVDGPVEGVYACSPANPMLHQRIASHLARRSQSEERGERAGSGRLRRSVRNRSSTPQPPGPVRRKALGLGSPHWAGHQRSQSLDSRRQEQADFLTPDAWIDSLSQENCSAPFPVTPDSLFRGRPAPETPGRTEPPSAAPPPPPPPPQDPGTTSRRPMQELPPPSSQPPRDPRRQASIFPDASRWPLAYHEAQSPARRPEAARHASGATLPHRGRAGRHREPAGPPPDDRGGPPLAFLHRGYSWPSPHHHHHHHNEAETEEREEGEGGRYRRQDAEVEIGGYQGVPESGGSYSSYASSGRGSMEPPNGRLSLCLSPTLASSPETTEEATRDTEQRRRRKTEDRRKASVDENYEWDSVDVSMEPGDQDPGDGGLLPSVNLLKSAPHCGHPSMHCSSEVLISSLRPQGHHLASCPPEAETVLF